MEQSKYNPLEEMKTRKTLLLALLVAVTCLLPSSFALNLKDRPVLKYGTAWKKEETAKLVQKAINAGFYHIDTACQPRHYREDLVGVGWRAAANELNLRREDLW